MPHFYRYRIEDNYEGLAGSGRTPAATPSTARRRVEGAEGGVTATVSLLGSQANITVTSEKDKMSLGLMFAQLDSTVRELREENKQLRAEVSQLEHRLSQSERSVRTDSQDTLQDTLQEIFSRCEDGDQKQREALHGLETIRGRVDQLDQVTRELAEKQENIRPLPAPHSDQQQTSPEQEEQIPAVTTNPVMESKDDIESLKSFVSEKVAGMKDLVSGPLSVIFDAIRSDDFVGEDNFLTFSKSNVNLGGGLDADTGRFTVPVGGVYLFLLNVYGAPRDPVVLSIRLNEMKEVSSCSGVGKASQTCILDLNKDDTVAVFVNDKTKLSDSDLHRFTHFAGILLRPDNVRF